MSRLAALILAALLTGCSAPTLEPGYRWYTATDRQGVTDEVIGGDVATGSNLTMRR